MSGFPSPFGGSAEDAFDDEGTFVAEHVPEPGPFLEDHDVLEGEAHVAVHEIARELFEERGVYDATFGYNLARLNLDARHPNAGYRYAEEADDPAVLRAEFTPTTEFCPQTTSLTLGSFRAWNAEPERHDYDLVRIRAAPMHHRAESINEQLAQAEDGVRESGLDVDDAAGGHGDAGSNATGDAALGGDGVPGAGGEVSGGEASGGGRSDGAPF